MTAWTMQYLRENYQHMSDAAMAEELSLATRTVTIMRERLGLMRYRKRFRGCDEDCFNCKYDDCLRPYTEV